MKLLFVKETIVMQNDKGQGQVGPDELTGKRQGPQGVDKAPGEETSSGQEDFVSHAQKGKNKVDGDPSRSEDQPLKP